MRKWLNLKNLIYLTIICLPTYLLRFRVFGIPTNVLEMLIGAVLAVWIWNLAETRHRLVSAMGMFHKKYIISVGLILAGLLISTLINKDYPAGFGVIKGWFLFPILFFVVVKSSFDKKEIIGVFRALFVSSFLVALAALGYFFLGNLTYDGRLQAFFNSPNYLAMYLAPGLIIIGMILTQEQKEKNEKITLVFSSIIILTALYLTFSYAAWAAAAISLMIVFLIQKKLFPGKIIILGAIIFSLLFLTQYKSVKFGSLAGLDERSSLASRVMIWKSAGKMLQNNWVFGIGPGNFQKTYLAYQKYYLPYLEWAVPHPHNLYLAFWLYGGIIGLLGFLSLSSFFFGDIFARINTVETRRCLVSTDALYISLGIMLYILSHGLFDTTYLKNDLSVVFWLCLLVL